MAAPKKSMHKFTVRLSNLHRAFLQKTYRGLAFGVRRCVDLHFLVSTYIDDYDAGNATAEKVVRDIKAQLEVLKR